MDIQVDASNNCYFVIYDNLEALNACYSAQRFIYNNPNNYNFVYIVFNNIKLNVTNIQFATMMYSKFLKLIMINGGVSLNDLMYSDLDLLHLQTRI
jgi:hypothetical protein